MLLRTNFSSLRKLRRLKIESDPTDVKFLVQLSSFPGLATPRSSFPIACLPTRDGFRPRISNSRFANASYSSADSSEVLNGLTYIDAYTT